MAKVLVLYYSSYGHVETLAHEIAAGATAAGASVDVKRVPELVPEEVAKASGYKLDQIAPVAKIQDLPNYDAIVVGTGTRFGRISSQKVDEITGGAPYGATTVAGPDGKRAVSESELAGARYQGRRIAEVAAKLHG